MDKNTHKIIPVLFQQQQNEEQKQKKKIFTCESYCESEDMLIPAEHHG